jgi:hypothetical protein
MKNQNEIVVQESNSLSLPNVSKTQLSVLEAKKNGKKIQDSTLQEVQTELKYVFAMLGLKGENLPTPEQAQVLLNNLYSYHSNLNLEEFRLAFEFAVTRKTDVQVTVFQNFNTDYMNQILIAYKRFVQEKKLLIEKEEVETQKSQKRILFDSFSNIVQEYKICFQSKKIKQIEFMNYIELSIYEIWFLTLERECIINVSIEDKQNIMKQSRELFVIYCENEKIKNTSMIKRFSDLKKKKELPSEEIFCKKIARAICLNNYFMDLIVEEKDPNFLVKSFNKILAKY